MNSKKYHYRATISSFEMSVFYRQLATLINAGVPLAQSFAILLQNQEKIALHNLINSLKQDLENGKSLTSGLSNFPRYIDRLTCHLVQIAEKTGTLDKMLMRIAQYKEKSLALKSKIKQALIYPSLILLVALLISITMLLFVVPRFADLFQSFHHTLPPLTLAVLHLSEWIRSDYGLLAIPILLGMLFVFQYRQSPALKLYTDQLLLKLPILGHFSKKVILARFARTLATIFAAGIPITDALKMLIQTSGNEAIKIAISKLHLSIVTGQQLHNAMRLNSLFPSMMTQMIKVGEESGSLEQMLEKIADFYESDIDSWVNNFSHVLEPLIIMILGVLIGGLVIALYLPIFQLGTVI